MKVMVNCGHGKLAAGGWDPGCAFGNYTEAGLMLPITKAAVKYLRSYGLTVLSDADTNNDKNMTEDVEWANKEKVAVYVSIHCDYSGSPSGVMPLYVSDRGKELAVDLNKAIMSGIPMKSRGVQKRVDLYELNATDMTACILETGSIQADLTIFKDKADLYGKCIAKGICDYLGIKTEQEKDKVTHQEIYKYQSNRIVNVYKDHAISSGKIGKLNKGSIYSATKKYRDDWVYIPYVKGWAPVKGSLGTYLVPVTKLVYTVTNSGGINIYPDLDHKQKRIANVKKGSQLTATKWMDQQAYFPEMKGWGAVSCLTIGNRRTVFLEILNRMGKEMAKMGFRYSTSNLPLTYAKAKQVKKTDCAHYVSYAMQELGLLPYGQYIWLNKHINGNGASAVKNSSVLKVTYPNKLPKDCGLVPGDIVGYGYTVNGVEGQHTQVYAGKNSLGQMVWYSGGTSDVNGGNFGPKVKPSYANRKVNVLIRIKV